jgi:dihydroflavonol-4-reductase
MQVLVTGATGLLGNNITRRLLEDGHHVRVLVRAESGGPSIEGLPVEKAKGDVRDAASVEAAARDVQLVVHSAAAVMVGRRRLDFLQAVNVDGTRNVASAAHRVGARLLHVSSADAVGIVSSEEPADEETPHYPDTKLPYVITKRAAERVVYDEIEKGLDAVIVNPSYMLGPWDWKPSSGRMLLEVARGLTILAPRGYFNLCDVRDVAAGTIAAAERGRCGRRYLLAGATYSYLDAWRLFAEVTGGRRPWARMGPAFSAVVGWCGDIWGTVARADPEVNSAALAWARQPKNYSSARAEAELGYNCRPVRETVEDAWSWFKEHGYA